MIERLRVNNFKGLRSADIEFSPHMNIIVGNNETGKSTILEAINLALTGQLGRRAMTYDLHPMLFNKHVVKDFIARKLDGEFAEIPKIIIELFLSDQAELATLKGTNNSLRQDVPGLTYIVEIDDDLGDACDAFFSDLSRVQTLPTELYRITWQSFAGHSISANSIPINPALIDPASVLNSYQANRYIVNIAKDFLNVAQQTKLSISYRQMREHFHNDPEVKLINDELGKTSPSLSEKHLSLELDFTSRTGWETGVQPHLDGIPLAQVGKGEQNAVKIKLAIDTNSASQILLIEEPENHQSPTNLSRLIHHLEKTTRSKQVIVTTHSSFVLNKLGVGSVKMFNGTTVISIAELAQDTQRFFQRLSGYDTLRMVLAKRTILVEGPSDDLVFQRAYRDRNGKLPMVDGIEVISVRGLSFERFLQIAKPLALQVAVLTDNDGDPAKVNRKYADYVESEHIEVFCGSDPNLRTLEDQLVAVNKLEALNEVMGRAFETKPEARDYMSKNKTECALRVFEGNTNLVFPEYIEQAIG